MRVLVVEDEPALRKALTLLLDGAGYEVDAAVDARGALDAAFARPPDIVLLDLGLPDRGGVEVCAALRVWFRSPIIVLTADGAEESKVAALDAGADDYVTKPFSMPELLARLRVAERHRQLVAALVDDAVLRMGELWLDSGAHEAGVGDSPLSLTPKEFKLLEMLMRNQGRILTHQVLLAEVWAGDGDVATLRTHMTGLRRKLNAVDANMQILTEPGVGYRASS